jgi:hypothetical protein
VFAMVFVVAQACWRRGRLGWVGWCGGRSKNRYYTYSRNFDIDAAEGADDETVDTN